MPCGFQTMSDNSLRNRTWAGSFKSPHWLSCWSSLCGKRSARFTTESILPIDICIKENKTRKLAALRPDIGGRINGKRIAIEVQSSALTVPRILKRCHGYSKRNISILWVVPLCDELGEKPFRPRHFERYLHSIYYGRVYYWRAGFGSCLLPVHFGAAWTHVENRERRKKDAG